MSDGNNGKLANIAPAPPVVVSGNKAIIDKWHTKATEYLNQIDKLSNNVKKSSITIANAMEKANNMNSQVNTNAKKFKEELQATVDATLGEMGVVEDKQVKEYDTLIKRIEKAQIAKLYRTKTFKLSAKHAMTSWDTLNGEIIAALTDTTKEVRDRMVKAAKLFEVGFFVKAREMMRKASTNAGEKLKKKLNKIRARVSATNTNANANNGRAEMSNNNVAKKMAAAKGATASSTNNKKPNSGSLFSNSSSSSNLGNLNGNNNNNNSGRAGNGKNNGKAKANKMMDAALKAPLPNNKNFNNNMSQAVNNAVNKTVQSQMNNAGEGLFDNSARANRAANIVAGAAGGAQTIEALGGNTEQIEEGANVGAVAGAKANNAAQAAVAGMNSATKSFPGAVKKVMTGISMEKNQAAIQKGINLAQQQSGNGQGA